MSWFPVDFSKITDFQIIGFDVFALKSTIRPSGNEKHGGLATQQHFLESLTHGHRIDDFDEVYDLSFQIFNF